MYFHFLIDLLSVSGNIMQSIFLADFICSSVCTVVSRVQYLDSVKLDREKNQLEFVHGGYIYSHHYQFHKQYS